jgi:hypothetical protein
MDLPVEVKTFLARERERRGPGTWEYVLACLLQGPGVQPNTTHAAFIRKDPAAYIRHMERHLRQHDAELARTHWSIPPHLQLAYRKDELLSKVFSDAQGGVVPIDYQAVLEDAIHRKTQKLAK